MKKKIIEASLHAPLPPFETHYLSSSELLARTKTLVLEERRATVALIEHLEEIQTRLLYAELGYSSLWEFATRELGLSEGAAQRRIQAMRLVRDVPEAKEKIESGLLSLSNAAKVQSFRQAEKKQGRKPDPIALIKQVESLSQKECEKVLYQISPESLPAERERIVSAEGAREIKLIVSAQLYEKLERLKGLLAHSMTRSNQGATLGSSLVASYADLLEYMADQSLRVIEKKKGISLAASQLKLQSAQVDKTVRVQADRDQTSNGSLSTAAAAETSAIPFSTHVLIPADNRVLPAEAHAISEGKSVQSAENFAVPVQKLEQNARKRVPIRAGIKRAVWEKAQAQCQIVANNKRCTSLYQLEIDHITPIVLGGTNEESNLRLVCRTHNQLNIIGNLDG